MKEILLNFWVIGCQISRKQRHFRAAILTRCERRQRDMVNTKEQLESERGEEETEVKKTERHRKQKKNT